MTANYADATVLRPLVAAMRNEGRKPSIAISSAFVLVEWCGLLIRHLAGTPTWEHLKDEILLACADALEKCLQPVSRRSIAQSAITTVRKAFRSVLTTSASHEEFLVNVVTILSAKSNHSTAHHAPILGLIAGLAARLASAKPVLQTLKPRYYEFYIREIIGSRSPIPRHITRTFGDFFLNFTSLGDFKTLLLPAIEKGLLRAPEVILGGVLKPLVESLPSDFDLSTILEGNLLKPLLSNVKSSNPANRNGAIEVFHVIASRCSDLNVMNGVVEHIASPLASGKIASPDQRILYADMLAALPLSSQGAYKASSALAAVASKEGNEAALAAETSAFARSVTKTLNIGGELSKPMLDVLGKGLLDKKPAARRLWLLRIGAVLLALEGTQSTTGVVSFLNAVIPRFISNFEEVLANAALASQNGIAVGAFVLTVATPALKRQNPDSSISTSLTKVDVSSHALSLSFKQAFLLNPKVYSKVNTEEDLNWFVRALASVAVLLNDKTDKDVLLAWAEAIIYAITAYSVPPMVRRNATKTLARLYAQNSGSIAKLIVAGLWSILEHGHDGDRAAKFDQAHFIQVLRSICPEPDGVAPLGAGLNNPSLEAQACAILVLSRKELIPRSSWIDMCLRMGIDPGNLTRNHLGDLVREIEFRASAEQQVSVTQKLYRR